MKLEEIKRELLTLPEIADDCRSLGKEAEEILGYSALREFAEKKPADLKPLQRLLAELQIEVLDEKHVQSYQTEHMIEVATVKFAEWQKSNPSPDYGWFMSPRWGKHKIADYKQPIPEFVLAKAVQIKKALPGVIIFVEHLEENPDPFLIVQLSEKEENADYSFTERYYVEAWAEPKFEARHL